jgi:hypothetical protein
VAGSLGWWVRLGSTKTVREVFSLDENNYRPVLDGCREGDNARDAYADAIEWWNTQLLEIEEELAKRALTD